MAKKQLPFEALQEDQTVKWLEPSTGKVETGTWFAESNQRGWILVNWNGKRWLVEKKAVLQQRGK